jgi:hypothetical protein
MPRSDAEKSSWQIVVFGSRGRSGDRDSRTKNLDVLRANMFAEKQR